MEKIQIWNMSLGFIGLRGVSSSYESSAEAVQCAVYWDIARRQVLRDFPWNFAMRRAYLSRVEIPLGFESEYRFAYALPIDCLRVWGFRLGGRRHEYILVYGEGSCILLSNCEDGVLEYTADVDSVLADDLFSMVLARKLATLLAMPLLKANISKVKELEELYLLALSQAYEASASEGYEVKDADSWLNARKVY